MCLWRLVWCVFMEGYMIFVYGGLYDVFVEGCMVCGCRVSLWKVVGYAHAGLYDVFIEGCLVLVCCVYAALYRLSCLNTTQLCLSSQILNVTSLFIHKIIYVIVTHFMCFF